MAISFFPSTPEDDQDKRVNMQYLTNVRPRVRVRVRTSPWTAIPSNRQYVTCTYLNLTSPRHHAHCTNPTHGQQSRVRPTSMPTPPSKDSQTTTAMTPNVDPAILKALGIDGQHARIASHGGSGFSATFKLSTTIDGQPVNYFVKTGSGKAAELMFTGEHASLNAIHNAVPSLCPKSYAHGAMSLPNKYFLVTDFLDLASTAPGGSGQSLAAKLARLHTTPAPIPDGHDKPMFGFPVPTCCGETAQDNSWKPSWAEFYADNRLRGILRDCVSNHGEDDELSEAVERVASKVVPRLVGESNTKDITPVLVHGDLWSGNHSRGRIGGKGGAEEVVFDPSAVYGHSEYELGIMRMFGGFGASFWHEYEALVPRADPREEWEDRLALYEL
ncbi:phosphotransferase enzyme family protein [Metarhizium album ARSEF 1941]|uniref:protein-ribulosamine 3-kinase n=1 Tax=Metarhizium album (strain ARSEF 1941) TaxID=1081103 RepID=A0A0B2X218_METAS|nr:phosphotransferase enzyme family protein [Metarhizium album ARSEF 1941]KHN99235.1 phosphotransferase enzyme family protein [Metarhizium album ARSEF 1941]